MKSLIILLSLCLVGVMADRPCHKNPKVNGCSIPIEPKIWFEDLFAGACDHHDLCYYCHTTYGKTQDDCDFQLLRLTFKSCPKNDFVCFLAAISYYIGVNVGGNVYYKMYNEPLDFCDEEWVQECL